MDSRERLVRRYYEAIDEEEYDRVFDLFSDDVVYHRPGRSSIEGIEAFEEFYLDERPLEDGTHDMEDVLLAGDTAIVRGRFAGRQNGEKVEFGFVDLHEFEGEEIQRRWTYTDRGEV